MIGQTDFIIPFIVGLNDNIEDQRSRLKYECNMYGLNFDIKMINIYDSFELIKEYNNDENVICIITTNYLYNSINEISMKPIFKYYNNIIMNILRVCNLIDNRFSRVIKNIHNNHKNICKINNLLNRNYIRYEPEKKYVNKYTSVFNNIQFTKSGKIRDIYSIPDKNDLLMLTASNKISSFDRILGEIPYKGAILNKISKWWFKECNFVPNHLDDLDLYNNIGDSRSIIVKKCKVYPIEFVMRGYMTGSTNTSIWKNYEKGRRLFCGHVLRENYVKNEQLDKIILTPTTKSDQHDMNISEKQIIDNKIMTKEEWDICKKHAYELFRHGQYIADKKGLILADTKYEFGKDYNGKICLVDELHTPDSSRFWIKHTYENRLRKGLEPDQISKEFVRLWITKNVKNPYDKNEEITLPLEIINKCTHVYKSLEEILCS